MCDCGMKLALGKSRRGFQNKGNKRVELQERLITCANLQRRLKNQNPHADKVAASSVLYQQKFLLAETKQQLEVPPFGLLFFELAHAFITLQ
jgi:hypothetical protein